MPKKINLAISDEQFIELYKSKKNDEVAKFLGISGVTLTKMARQKGVLKNKIFSKKERPNPQPEIILNLRQAKVSLREIADLYKVNIVTVWKWIKKWESEGKVVEKCDFVANQEVANQQAVVAQC